MLQNYLSTNSVENEVFWDVDKCDSKDWQRGIADDQAEGNEHLIILEANFRLRLRMTRQNHSNRCFFTNVEFLQ